MIHSIEKNARVGLRFVKVCITAIDDGKSLVLLDAKGQRLKRVEKSYACEAHQSVKDLMQLRFDWSWKFALMSHRINEKTRRNLLSEWDRKIAVWQQSVRWRKNRTRSPRKSSPTCYSSDVRKSWESAVAAMAFQYQNKFYETRNRQINPWRLWAQTVSGNLRRRKNGGCCDGSQEKKLCNC